MKSYLRFLSCNKLYTAIMAVGLSVSLAFVIPLINIMADKKAKCRAHDRYEDIYTVCYSGNMFTDINFGDYLEAVLPEIESSTSFMSGPRTIIDREFFKFFPFEFTEGDESFLESRNNIAVSERYAAMLSDSSAIGSTIRIDNLPYNVAAVFKSGRNDILKECDILQNIASFKELPKTGGRADGVTMIVLHKGHDRAEMEEKILAAADVYKEGDEEYMKMKESGAFRGIVRYDELPSCICNYGQFKEYSIGQMLMMYILICIIFAVAILNYINLSVAVSTTRAKENATRKLVGASRFRLISAGMGESLIFTSACFIIGIFLSRFTGRFIEGLMTTTGITDFSAGTKWNASSILLFCVLILVTAVTAGIGPSVMSARFSPLDITKGSFRHHSKRWLSKVFISIQTVVSVVLLSVVLMLNTYYRAAVNTDMSYDIDNIAIMKVPAEDASRVIAQASRHPEILSAGMADGLPGTGSISGVIVIPDGERYLFNHVACDKEGFKTIGLDIIRQYDEDAKGLWLTPLTESVIAQDSMLLSHIHQVTGTDHIAGTVNDFPGAAPMLYNDRNIITFASVRDTVEPAGVVFRTTDDHKRCLEIINEACSRLEINEFDGMKEPEYGREILAETLAPTKVLFDMLGIVAVLVVIMSMMGLAGMSIHFADERKNDIAVRRIFGATENSEIARNLRFYVAVTAVASVIAVCITELIRDVYQEYGIRPDNIWAVYTASILLSFAMSMTSVLWQTLRAARTNPAEALKKE